MTGSSDSQAEGRQRPGGDSAPLFLVIAVASILVLLGFFVQGDSVASLASETNTSLVSAADGSVTTTLGTTKTPLTHPIRNPVRIVIPAIEVDAKVLPVGLLDDGDMETPTYGFAGWYSLGPAPGEPGPAVMLAHVDSTKGPDVFYNLSRLRAGDEIRVFGIDGDVAAFSVDAVEQQPKIELPRERIWLYGSEALIRLITCGGKYDRRIHHYLSNVIVYGHLIR
jgi:sortase (surface protein transpeptidase)